MRRVEIKDLRGPTRVLAPAPDVALFDADGTVIHGYEEHCRAEEVALMEEHGFAHPGLHRIRGLSGLPLYRAFLEAQKKGQRNEFADSWGQLNKLFKARVAAAMSASRVRLGVHQDAHRLAERWVGPRAIVTNATRNTFDERWALVPNLNKDLFDHTVTSCCVGAFKPNPAHIHEAMQRTGSTEAVLFGDAYPDAEAAINAGNAHAVVAARGRTLPELEEEFGSVWGHAKFSLVNSFDDVSVHAE